MTRSPSPQFRLRSAPCGPYCVTFRSLLRSAVLFADRKAVQIRAHHIEVVVCLGYKGDAIRPVIAARPT
jgi:hypothetical protein